MGIINKTICEVYDSISKKEGDSNTRYKSWEWCHKFFMENKEKYYRINSIEQENLIDTMSLHLAFYLASWGMYRGSSFLIQRDFKAHKQAIKSILELKYFSLWNYRPLYGNIGYKLIFDQDGIYWKIKNAYRPDIPTDTLITKILLGTFGCIPAFDKYLKIGLKLANMKNKLLNYSVVNIEKNSKQIFSDLENFYLNNEKEFILNRATNVMYPPMKLVDMYLWRIGGGK